MKSSDLHRNALSWCVASAVLSACSGSVGSPIMNPTATPQHSRTFKYTGATEEFTVPPGVAQLTIDATGGSGAGTAQRDRGRPGGHGDVVEATVPVNAGQVLTIVVGGKAKGAHAGFNGGGAGANAGGGGSDVRTGKGNLADRIVVAGGGGGAGESFEWAGSGSSSSFYWCYGGAGGNGGAATGDAGRAGQCAGGGGGSGGSQKSGGDGGYGGPYGGSSRGGSPGCAGAAGGAGTLLDGGAGAGKCTGEGGGGGGGYYGGGGGGSGGCCAETGAGSSSGGGGGGSSFVEKSATSVRQTPGTGPADNGKVVIFWS